MMKPAGSLGVRLARYTMVASTLLASAGAGVVTHIQTASAAVDCTVTNVEANTDPDTALTEGIFPDVWRELDDRLHRGHLVR